MCEMSPPSFLCRESVSWVLSRLPSDRGTLVSSDLCQRIHDSMEILDRALSQYR